MIEGFEQKDYEIKLKYDGERERNIYSVIIIPLLDRSKIVSDDTDNLSFLLDEMLDESRLSLTKEASKTYVDLFKSLINKLHEKYGSDYIFTLSAFLSDELMFNVYLSGIGESIMKRNLKYSELEHSLNI